MFQSSSHNLTAMSTNQIFTLIRPISKACMMVLFTVIFMGSALKASLIASNITLLADVTIKGVLMDANSRESLPGATVLIEGTIKGTSADLDGNYTISRVKTIGPVVLVASYMGYEEQRIEVVLVDGLNTIDILMQPQRLQGEEIVITTQAMGQIQAINQQRNSNTITNIVSRDRIQELPDVNAAESVGRLPGVSIQRSGGEANKIAIRGLSPRFNNVTVNGVRLLSTDANDRSVDLSLVSSNTLDGIEVTKALTPDKDADALGGSVNLRLRNAPDKLFADIQVQGGYTALQQTYDNYKVSGSLSNRFLNSKLGIIVNGNADRYDRSADIFNSSYELRLIQNENVPIVNQLNLNENALERSRLGGSVVMDYDVKGGQIQFNAIYNQLKNEGFGRNNILQLNNNQHRYRLSQFENTTEIFNGSIGLEQRFSWVEYEVNASFASSRSNSPNDYSWGFLQEDARDTGVDQADLLPIDVPGNFSNILERTYMSDLNLSDRLTQEDETSLKADVKFPFIIGKTVKGYVKTGAKYRYKNRENDQNQKRSGVYFGGDRELRFAIADALPDLNLDPVQRLPMSAFLDTYSRDNFIEGDYPLGFTAQPDLMRTVTQAALDGNFMAYPRFQTLANDYIGNEEYMAGYVMAEIEIGKYIIFMPGVRYESEETNYTGKFSTALDPARGIPLEAIDFRDTTSVRSQDFFLPMVHLQIKPTDWLGLRLAYTESINRPDFRQYAPNTFYNPMSNFATAPNPNLETARAKNLDASLSMYNSKLGFLTLSAFSKEIENLVWGTNFTLIPGQQILPELFILEAQGRAPNVGTFINNPNTATIEGFEIDWQTRFWYLPSFLSGFVLNINYTYINSETLYPTYELRQEAIEPRPRRPPFTTNVLVDTTFTGNLPDQPTDILNVTLGYDLKDFSARISMLYQARTTTGSFGRQFETADDLFVDDYFRIDVSLKQKLPNNIQVFLNMNNLNNRSDDRIQAQSAQFPTRRELYGFTMDLGLRYTF